MTDTTSTPPEPPAEAPPDAKALREAARREAGLVARMRRHYPIK